MRTLPVLMALPLVISFGLVEGHWTDRWATTADADAAVARLAGLPLAVGDWEGQAQALDGRQIERAGIRGYRLHRYVHRPTGEEVSVLVVCGKPGPISVHTPDVCYEGAGYRLATRRERRSFDFGWQDSPVEFFTARFRKGDAAVPEELRVLWAWSATGAWATADNPRLQFARHSFLYKMYVTRQLTRRGEGDESDPVADFLRLFLPELNHTLFPPV
jgi:hypothetical protein